MPITEEEVELKPNFYQILKVKTWTGKDGKEHIRKTDSGVKKINGVRMDKWKKHDKSWLNVDPIADVIFGQPIPATYKVTTDEEGLNIDTDFSGDFQLKIENETNPGKSLLIRATVTNGIGNVTILGSEIKEVGKYKFNNGSLKQTQMNGEISFNVTTN